MDYSDYRRSSNVEDTRDDPWTPLYHLYSLLGMERTPSQIIADPYKPIRPEEYPPQPTYAPGSLQDQAGTNAPLFSQYGPMTSAPATKPVYFSQDILDILRGLRG